MCLYTKSMPTSIDVLFPTLCSIFVIPLLVLIVKVFIRIGLWRSLFILVLIFRVFFIWDGVKLCMVGVRYEEVFCIGLFVFVFYVTFNTNDEFRS